MPDNLASRDGSGRSVPRQPPYLLYSGCIWCSTDGIPPDFRGGACLFMPPYAIGPVASSSVHAIGYRWRLLPRDRRHRASSPQGSFSNGCCLCRSPWTFPHPLLLRSGHVRYRKYRKNAIGTQMRHSINSGLTRWRLVECVDAIAESRRNTVSTHHIHDSA